MNNLNCIQAPCQVEQCGIGYINNIKQNYAIACEGSYSKPVCKCRTDGFIMDTHTQKCIIDPECGNSVKGQICNECGECSGDYFHFQCKCRAPHFIRLKTDAQVCEDAPCQLVQCGHTDDDSKKQFYHATKCYGTYSKPSCNCIQGYRVDPKTQKCVPADCSSIVNVCDGNGECEGTTVDHICECYDNYDNPNGNMKACKPANCSTHENVCNGQGECSGTFFVFDCRCYPGFQQKRLGNGVATCERASCTDDQCGGTPLSPFGTCGKGYFNEYNCTCNNDYTHPRLPNKQRLLSKCDYKCDVSNCGEEGVKECIGTLNAYHCVCQDDFMHPRDSLGHHIKTTCRAKCHNQQCGGDSKTEFGICEGTKKEFTCNCSQGYSHPQDKGFEAITTKCRESCGNEQCGNTNGTIHGNCTGSTKRYHCKCEEGFQHPVDYTGDPIYTMCKDIDECENKNLCDPNAKCVNTPGSYRCECNVPYAGEGSRLGKCYLDGGWGEWKYEICSVTCGSGTTVKSRDCFAPIEYRTDDLCQGVSVVENLKCNQFPCKDLCDEVKCECGFVRQFVDGDEPKEDLLFFHSIKGFKFHHATAMLTKFNKIASHDICQDSSLDKVEVIKKKLEDDMKSVKNALKEYIKAKSEMRSYINCNENPNIRENLFKTYKKLTSHMFMTKFVMNDLEFERKKIYKQIALCINEEAMSFGEMMNMVSS